MVVGTVAVGVPLIASLTGAGAGAILGQVFGQKGPRSPQVQPGDILRLALGVQALSERGLQPVVSTDPFTGDTVLSTADQSGVLTTLLGEKFAREALAPTAADIREVFDFQQEAIRLGRLGLLEPGLQAGAPVETPTVRDQVVANLTVSSARVVAPGVVIRRSSDLDVRSRLGGPCAGVNTGLMRLRCARGGFA